MCYSLNKKCVLKLSKIYWLSNGKKCIHLFMSKFILLFKHVYISNFIDAFFIYLTLFLFYILLRVLINLSTSF